MDGQFVQWVVWWLYRTGHNPGAVFLPLGKFLIYNLCNSYKYLCTTHRCNGEK